jgi:hypothetical protein
MRIPDLVGGRRGVPAVVVVAATTAADGEGKSTSMSSCWPLPPLAEGEITAGWSSKCGNSPLPDPVTAGESEMGDLIGDSFNSSNSDDCSPRHNTIAAKCHHHHHRHHKPHEAGT